MIPEIDVDTTGEYGVKLYHYIGLQALRNFLVVFCSSEAYLGLCQTSVMSFS